MKRRRTHRMAIVGACAFVLLACNAIVGLDRDYAIGPTGPDAHRDADVDANDASVVSIRDGAVSDASSDADAEAPCPNLTGPTMVRVGSFCIDSTEVTEQQYAEFLASDAGFGGAAPAVCTWKSNFTPGMVGLTNCRWNPAQYPQLPVTCIDWCDAYAYCRWAGKHLCGAIGGGAVPWDSGADSDPQKDEWYRACTKGDGREFPYGPTYDLGACNDYASTIGELTNAGANAACQGGYAGIYDMVGNAFEFANSCSANTGASDYCLLRGGSWSKTHDEFSRCNGRGVLDRRDNRFDDFGIRCCGD